jgi:hypothetical protein
MLIAWRIFATSVSALADAVATGEFLGAEGKNAKRRPDQLSARQDKAASLYFTRACVSMRTDNAHDPAIDVRKHVQKGRIIAPIMP